MTSRLTPAVRQEPTNLISFAQTELLRLFSHLPPCPPRTFPHKITKWIREGFRLGAWICVPTPLYFGFFACFLLGRSTFPPLQGEPTLTVVAGKPSFSSVLP